MNTNSRTRKSRRGSVRWKYIKSSSYERSVSYNQFQLDSADPEKS